MTAIIWIAGIAAALSALGVVFSPQPMYSALSLVLAIGALAVTFLVLNAQFLFVVQLIVYAGAVMVLFVFIIALFAPGSEERFRVDARFIVGIVVALGVTLAVFGATRNGITFTNAGFRGQQIGAASDPYHTYAFDQGNNGVVNAAGNVQVVGGQLFTTFLLPFELTSLLLLVAAVGAVYLTRLRGSHTQPIGRDTGLQRRDEVIDNQQSLEPDPVDEERIEVEAG